MVQWLRLCTLNAGGLGSIPGQGTRSHMPQLKMPQTATKILHAATKTRHSQINKKILKKKKKEDGQRQMVEFEGAIFLLEGGGARSGSGSKEL